MGWRKQLDLSETIFSLSSGSLPCAVAIVKLVGPKAFAIATQLFTAAGAESLSSPLPRKRGMHLGMLHDLRGRPIDEIVVLSFVAPHSFSGEDTVEFHCHGSISVVRSLENALLELKARPAERGEFSYRAHLNGKLSASDLDSLADVYVAREPEDLGRIYARREGAIRDQIEALRSVLIRLQAILDTAVDFSDEYSAVVSMAREPLTEATRGCSAIIQRYSSFRAGSAAPRLVLAGRPNAGKSSLFNSILCRYRAIVNEEPGTTRDVIEEDIQVGGRGWKLVDTAGVREASTGPEQEGITLGEEYLGAGSYWLLVVDGTKGVSKNEHELLARHGGRPHAIVWNKRDLAQCLAVPPSLKDEAVVELSAKTGEGLDRLWDLLRTQLPCLGISSMGVLPSAVHCVRLSGVVDSLEMLERELVSGVPPEYLAERNRNVLNQLEEVIGEVTTEDVLDRVFGEFCIGK